MSLALTNHVRGILQGDCLTEYGTQLQCRALGWLAVDLYLTGRQPAQSERVKAPPSPMSTSSADSDSAKPRRYARLTPLLMGCFSGLD